MIPEVLKPFLTHYCTGPLNPLAASPQRHHSVICRQLFWQRPVKWGRTHPERRSTSNQPYLPAWAPPHLPPVCFSVVPLFPASFCKAWWEKDSCTTILLPSADWIQVEGEGWEEAERRWGLLVLDYGFHSEWDPAVLWVHVRLKIS